MLTALLNINVEIKAVLSTPLILYYFFKWFVSFEISMYCASLNLLFMCIVCRK